MNKLEIKSISHVKHLLEKTNSYGVYSTISNKLKELEIDNDKLHTILKVLDNSINENMSKNIKESEEWLDILLNEA